jgi:ATP-dependent Clp protease ATP-binding subunit ClpA
MRSPWPWGKDHNQIDSAHLLQALLNQQGGSARPLLQRAGANLDALQQSLRGVHRQPAGGQPTPPARCTCRRI